MTALYLHIPFCAHACPYCDFSFVLLKEGAVKQYLHAVDIEMAHRAEEAIWAAPFSSVFIGGGTPTALSRSQLDLFFSRLHRHFQITPDAEVTVEANPETLTIPKLDLLRKWGVNRLSIGVQSFTPESLRRLGRHHSLKQAMTAFERARQVGFDNINIDLMFGAPEQTEADWEASLRYVVDLAPEHISVYGLTIEPGTPFARLSATNALDLPDEERHIAMYDRALDRLDSVGYVHYEVSNLARAGAACRHNLSYWNGSNYLGLGPSAHSHIDGRRFANVRDLTPYLERINAGASAVDFDETLSDDEHMHEFIMLGLRQVAGMDAEAFRIRFGEAALAARAPVIERLTDANLLERRGTHLRLTRRGFAVADSVCEQLM